MRMGCDSPEKIRNKLPSLQADLIDPNQFKKFYSFAFDVSRADGQKVLDLDTAITLWRMMLADKFTHLEAWAGFLENEFKKSITVIPLPAIHCPDSLCMPRRRRGGTAPCSTAFRMQGVVPCTPCAGAIFWLKLCKNFPLTWQQANARGNRPQSSSPISLKFHYRAL